MSFARHGGRGTGSGDLEDEQTGPEEKRRSLEEGNEARLTALAAPRPVSEHPRRGSLEKEENAAKRTVRSKGDSEEDDAFLTEVAAPAPVEEDRDSTVGRDDLALRHNTAVDERGNPSSEDEEKAKAELPKKSQHIWTHIVTISWLILFSFLGTLARLGTETVTTYPYAPFSSTVLWANLGGSFLMGFLLEDRRLFRDTVKPHLLSDDKDDTHRHIDKSKKILPLYVGLATGFCGSFTSFSTFVTDGFEALTNNLPTASPTSPYHTVGNLQSRNGGFSFMAVLAIIIVHPAVSISALKTGAHLAVGLEPYTPSLPARLIHGFLDPVGVVLGCGCWLGAVLLSIWPVHDDWRRRATMSLVFAPLGTLLRFYLSKFFNARIPSFPLGTFMVNVFGTCIEGMCYDLQHARSVVGSVPSGRANPCAVLDGVMQGFCGCATTVSTWVAELNGLRRRHAWIYGVASVGVALAFQVVIMGSMAWTSGFDDSCSVRP